ncbi:MULTISPECIES: ribonuclease P protein component [unclassified Mycoplasma]|uniref:ribonuclease P protein component n=1 Tax=unclassified Mycoplasma TaxID=2683645 RepID=UPI000FDE46E8
MDKKFVLRKNWQFKDVIASKKQFVSKYLVLYYRPNQSNLKVGISISKKVANAIRRNYYRRQVRQILDQTPEVFNLNYDVVLIIRKPFMPLDFQSKAQAVKQIFERL